MTIYDDGPTGESQQQPRTLVDVLRDRLAEIEPEPHPSACPATGELDRVFGPILPDGSLGPVHDNGDYHA